MGILLTAFNRRRPRIISPVKFQQDQGFTSPGNVQQDLGIAYLVNISTSVIK